MGYIRDLAISISESEINSFLETIEMDLSDYERLKQKCEFLIDPIGEKIAMQKVGNLNWKKLSVRSQFFISTALAYFEEYGYSPQLDYAPISLEVCKALEVELQIFFQGFLKSLDSSTITADESKRHEVALFRMLENGRPPSLGEMGYLFKDASKKDTNLSKSLNEYILTFPDTNYFLSRKFWNDEFQRVLNKFRNGGAHDSAINHKTCEQAIECLIGNEERLGLTLKIAALCKHS